MENCSKEIEEPNVSLGLKISIVLSSSSLSLSSVSSILICYLVTG